MTEFRTITEGLRFPEGPIAMPDGSVVLVEIEAARLTRVQPDGSKNTIAETGGGPNGAAIGPDGACYICNNGGFNWEETPERLRPVGQADDYSGGRIERVVTGNGPKQQEVESHPDTGRARKWIGSWWFPALRAIAPFKFLRGTPLDPFGHSEERKRERQLIADYEALIEEILTGLDHDSHALAVELAAIPEQIRGYGHVKTAHLADAKAREAQLLEAWRNPEAARSAAE